MLKELPYFPVFFCMGHSIKYVQKYLRLPFMRIQASPKLFNSTSSYIISSCFLLLDPVDLFQDNATCQSLF